MKRLSIFSSVVLCISAVSTSVYASDLSLSLDGLDRNVGVAYKPTAAEKFSNDPSAIMLGILIVVVLLGFVYFRNQRDAGTRGGK